MAEQEELSGFRPPEDLDEGINHKIVIYELVKKKGCSYPAEIRRETGFSKDTLYAHLFQLVKEEQLVKHNLYGRTKVPSWLKPRIEELWSMNIKGDRITRMAWYTLSGVEDTSMDDKTKSEEVHKKRALIIDYWMNVKRGVEPSDEQKEAAKGGKLTTDGVNIIPASEQEKAILGNGD